MYGGQVITTRRVDFHIWDGQDELLLEVKARPRLTQEDREQCLRYLQQGRQRICLLVNFGEKPIGRHRLVHTPPDAPQG
jgi:GxxExxY protein